ncbi:uncharacterized protein LAJ45_07250 [Morchella importuna]|uniref:uncharacterized protein n=1 Tax=Morchella importuna TaxID=1174673 RepID=UPI001E8CDB81|nr:uncharacterized protein LAJ45_07250 [Morchella importuna]KAH8148539.1 hypothetical protein LAJ45_07250 [Morchella importuna]
MATKLPFPPSTPGAQVRRKRRYTCCTRNWSWTPSCPRASRIPVARRRGTRRPPAAPATSGPVAEVRPAVPATNGTMVTATAKRRFGFNAPKRVTGKVKDAPKKEGEHEKGCTASGPGPCSVMGCFSSVSKHRAKFEQMSSPTVEKSPEMRKVPVKQENRRPAAPTRTRLPAPAHRAAFLKCEGNGHGSIGRRIRPALAGLFEGGPPNHTLESNNTARAPPLPLTGRHIPAPSSSPDTAANTLRAPQPVVTAVRTVSSPALTREQEVLRRLEEAHRSSPVFRCAGPRNMNDYSEGGLTMTYFGDPEGLEECPRRAGIRNWVKGTWKSLRLTGGGEEARVLVLPRGWLEEGE